MTAVLTAEGLASGYGAGPVIHDVDIEVHAGEVVSLMGSNGAGKTTTLLTLSGVLPALSGRVTMNGRVTKAPLHARARNGLAFVTEERSVFMGLTTRENLRVGKVSPAQAYELFPELQDRIGVRGGLLSGGEQQMLTVARAIGRHPKVLLADELSLGLAPMFVTRLLEALRKAASEEGTGVLIVEQHARKALKFADRAYVMRNGRIELEGPAPDLLQRLPEIEEQYLSRG